MCLNLFKGCNHLYVTDTLFNNLFNSIAKELYHWKRRNYKRLYSNLQDRCYVSESITKRMNKVLSWLEPIAKEVDAVLFLINVVNASFPGDVFNFFVERSIKNLKKELGIKTKPLK